MEYQKEAMRTNDGKASYRLREAQEHKRNLDLGGIINACLGLSGEVGELNDLIKKWIFHEREVDMEHLKKNVEIYSGMLPCYVILFNGIWMKL